MRFAHWWEVGRPIFLHKVMKKKIISFISYHLIILFLNDKYALSNIKKFNLWVFLNGAYEYMYINRQRLCLQIWINYQLGLFRRQIKVDMIECFAKKKGWQEWTVTVYTRRKYIGFNLYMKTGPPHPRKPFVTTVLFGTLFYQSFAIIYKLNANKHFDKTLHIPLGL
jgi:hypothetical protein